MKKFLFAEIGESKSYRSLSMKRDQKLIIDTNSNHSIEVSIQID